jgi:hypothetical protein
MIDLKKITKGRVVHAPRVLIFGMDGVGKTTFAAGSPDPFFIDANKGSLEHDVRRLLVDTWDEALACVSAVESGQIACGTLVLDSLTDLEAMSHAKLFAGTTIDAFGGGYGKGETYALTEWRAFLFQLEKVWRKGIGIIIVAHCMVKKFDDPTGPGYDRFELSARPKLAGAIRQWVSAVLFAREEVVTGGAKGESKRATTTGVRYIHTSRKPAYDAKTRGSSLFPERLPLSWTDFSAALKSDVSRTADLSNGIDSMLAEISDGVYAGTVRAYLKEYPNGIVEAHNRVAAKVEELRNKKQGE